MTEKYIPLDAAKKAIKQRPIEYLPTVAGERPQYIGIDTLYEILDSLAQPVEPVCPNCHSELVRDEVDNGVGIQYSPWRCDNCKGW